MSIRTSIDKPLLKGSETETKKGMTTFEGALSLLSTIIGGGIVALPFSIRQFGIPLGLLVLFAVMELSYLSAYLWLKIKKLMPG